MLDKAQANHFFCLCLFQYSKKEMSQKLQNHPELAGKLIPTNFSIGCRVRRHCFESGTVPLAAQAGMGLY